MDDGEGEGPGFITMATSETNSESGPINPNVQHGGGTNYILNGLDNALYNVYSPMVNAKALWESLERKYKTEDAGSKKFVVGKFLDFKMVDSKTVISQVQEFQLILHDIHAEGMVLGESFQVAALIEKLPPTWKDFKNYLKHKRKEMKLEDLIVRLRIEEDNRQSEKKAGNYHQEAKANVVEQGGVIDTYFPLPMHPDLVAVSSDPLLFVETHGSPKRAFYSTSLGIGPSPGTVLFTSTPVTTEYVIHEEDTRALQFSFVRAGERGVSGEDRLGKLITHCTTDIFLASGDGNELDVRSRGHPGLSCARSSAILDETEFKLFWCLSEGLESSKL
ncbi:hypothetical protein RJ639_040063 [Escallonia herrerae]|uniref:Uncharacterized protein n=2 Tax=Escallonia herrerae TaxID=1293975 RepID=A0AA88WKF8_9ASTE|nr:hypothetical protein RJ639_040063 [Escallonia herrerae]